MTNEGRESGGSDLWRQAEREGEKNSQDGDLLCSLGDLSHLYWLNMLLC